MTFPSVPATLATSVRDRSIPRLLEASKDGVDLQYNEARLHLVAGGMSQLSLLLGSGGWNETTRDFATPRG